MTYTSRHDRGGTLLPSPVVELTSLICECSATERALPANNRPHIAPQAAETTQPGDRARELRDGEARCGDNGVLTLITAMRATYLATPASRAP
ncbi:hypothetical protein [Streptomyces sp. DHE17-7]|uniref:hypothetical protein n=1 Tax=Streptomyces sp. DHE17-7 TaxID=2759949 RepID=UPI0022EA5FB0|nr:hypothetical protein [Streptomyces sp. DHE17-7]MBJ6622151.1 hypothetical protein [Streptomyces sp. DHE17-7]